MLVSQRPAAARPEVAYTPLPGSRRTEACFAGGGLAGLIAAYLIARDRREVTVLEAHAPGDPRETADVLPVASGIEASFVEIERRHGPAGARAAARNTAIANDAIEAIVRREHFACDFERLDGYFFGAEGEDYAGLEEEAAAARRAGVPGVEALAFAPLECDEPPPCVHYPYQAQLHGPKLAAGLARAIAREGGKLHSGVRVERLRPGRPSLLDAVDGSRIEADMIVVPAPGADLLPAMHAVMVRVPRGSVARALYWERKEGCTYTARLHTAHGLGDVLLVSGEASAEDLARWARRRFPRAGELAGEFTAKTPQAWDLFAFSGPALREPDSVHIGMACGNDLLTRATSGGMLLKRFFDQVPATAREAP